MDRQEEITMTNSHIGYSIVIANYNTGRYIEETIQSVIKQNYPNVQLIIIDGGSTDNSVDIIRRYEQYIDYWVSEKDSGQSEAFNKGFKVAKHDWLFWLNADDFLLENSLQTLDCEMRKILNKDATCQWFTFDNVVVNEDGTTNRVLYGPAWNEFFCRRLGPQIHSATSIFHKSLFEQSKRFDTALYWSMDLDLWYQFYNLGKTYQIIHRFIYGFRINDQSKTMSNGVCHVERSEERWRQTGYMYKKNDMHIQRNWIKWWRLYKTFTIYPQNIYFTILYRGKQWKWWK